jgi:hypothetical protein
VIWGHAEAKGQNLALQLMVEGDNGYFLPHPISIGFGCVIVHAEWY